MPGQSQPMAAQAPVSFTPRGEVGQVAPLQKWIHVGSLGLGYVACSAGLIAYNKYLIHEDRFPYAICLVFIHAIFCSACAGMLYLVMPSLFPSLSDPAKKVEVDSSLILNGALPIAVLFAAQLVLTNTAYLHSSVAFLQMMKEANLVLVYVLSLMASLEKFSWRSVGILVFIVFATTMTIHGEVNFSWTGFAIQGVGQIFECCKIVLQAMLLSSAGRKLDALTYVLLVMPLCALVLGIGMGLLMAFPHSHFLTPEWHHLVQWWPHLLGNACVAFALNVVIALFVKHSSAVSFILAGIVKDAMIVAAGTFFFHEIVSFVQAVGFGLQLSGIMLWSTIKSFPERFNDGIVAGFSSLACGTQPIKGKTAFGKDSYGSTKEEA
jgi:hypothetical protein